MIRGFEREGEREEGSRNALATKARDRSRDGRLQGSEFRLFGSGTTRCSYTMLRSSGGLDAVSGGCSGIAGWEGLTS